MDGSEVDRFFFNESQSHKIKVLTQVSKHFDWNDHSRKFLKFVRKLVNYTHEMVCCYWNSSKFYSVILLIPVGLWQSSLSRVRMHDNRSAVDRGAWAIIAFPFHLNHDRAYCIPICNRQWEKFLWIQLHVVNDCHYLVLQCVIFFLHRLTAEWPLSPKEFQTFLNPETFQHISVKWLDTGSLVTVRSGIFLLAAMFRPSMGSIQRIELVVWGSFSSGVKQPEHVADCHFYSVICNAWHITHAPLFVFITWC